MPFIKNWLLKGEWTSHEKGLFHHWSVPIRTNGLSLKDSTVCFRAHAKGNSFYNNESEIVFSVFIRSGNISVAGTSTW